MQISISKCQSNYQPNFGFKIMNNAKLEKNLVCEIESSLLVDQVKQKYPQTILSIKESLSNFKNALILEFSIGKGNKFSLCGDKNNFQALINKLKQSELCNFEQLIRDNKQVGEENFKKMFSTQAKSFMHYDTWQRLMNKIDI